jgi:hypothetical protein
MPRESTRPDADSGSTYARANALDVPAKTAPAMGRGKQSGLLVHPAGTRVTLSPRSQRILDGAEAAVATQRVIRDVARIGCEGLHAAESLFDAAAAKAENAADWVARRVRSGADAVIAGIDDVRGGVRGVTQSLDDAINSSARLCADVVDSAAALEASTASAVGRLIDEIV